VHLHTAEPRAHLVTMTPELARELLERNASERTSRSDQELVECYAEQMRRGEWLPTYDTLKVNASGGLMDGQHRLQAVIRSGWTGPMLVVTGVPDGAAWAMDPAGQLPPGRDMGVAR
jgi:hypothetical protein